MLEYKAHESFKHIYAKKVLQDWFKGVSENADGTSLAQFSWRVNRGPEQDYGIYLEYPIIREAFNRDGVISHWYHTGQFDEFFGDTGYEKMGFKNPCVPSYTELDRLQYLTVCVIDLVVMHKGYIRYGFEIVHNHPTPQWKIDIFKAANIEVYEVGADFILNMVETPSYILCTQIA